MTEGAPAPIELGLVIQGEMNLEQALGVVFEDERPAI